MTDWLKRINDIISLSDENVVVVPKAEELTLTMFKTRERKSTYGQGQLITQRESAVSHEAKVDLPLIKEEVKAEPIPMVETNESDNLKKLQQLKTLPRPRGTPLDNVESRVALIQSLLGDGEVFKTLQVLRWPQGVLCPRCHSSNVVRRDPPLNAKDHRHYYICLDCKGTGGISDFDDFTGLPIGSLHALRQWILCWYLIGFCSVNRIA